MTCQFPGFSAIIKTNGLKKRLSIHRSAVSIRFCTQWIGLSTIQIINALPTHNGSIASGGSWDPSKILQSQRRILYSTNDDISAPHFAHPSFSWWQQSCRPWYPMSIVHPINKLDISASGIQRLTRKQCQNWHIFLRCRESSNFRFEIGKSPSMFVISIFLLSMSSNLLFRLHHTSIDEEFDGNYGSVFWCTEMWRLESSGDFFMKGK